ncbi:MAG: L-fucose/L-arabinose isomerase family protein [Actinomycetota bacterium]
MIKVGFVPSHRVPFDMQWAKDMRDRTIKAVKDNTDIELVYPEEDLTPEGLVSNEQDAKKTIALFKEEGIDALLIGTMTFGEELPNLLVAEAFSHIPIQLFGTREGPFTADGSRRSDSFCGTISTAAGLNRRNIVFDFSGIFFPEEKQFMEAVGRFVRAALAYKNFMGAKVGTVGPRPAPFETCAINEVNLIENFRQKVVPITLLKLYSDMKKNSQIKEVAEIAKDIEKEYDTSRVDRDSIIRLAKLEYFLEKYSRQEELTGLGIQCWTAMQEEIGVSPCLAMGRLTDRGIMCACEVDVHGVLTMAMQYNLCSRKEVPHFIDWTIAHQEKDNTFFAWHCGNAPASLCKQGTRPLVESHSVLGKMLGKEASGGTAEFELKDGPVTICRLAEAGGRFRMLLAGGKTVEDKRKLRGSWKWIEVDNLDYLYRTIIEQGFIHHASMIFGNQRQEVKLFCKFAGIEVVEV